MIPKLKFKIDQRQDVKAYFDFCNNVKYDNGMSWKWAIIKIFPELQQYDPSAKYPAPNSVIAKFVKMIYAKKKGEIAEKLLKTKKLWRGKEKQFYELTSKLFNEKYWPQGKYIAYPTIWGMFPRDLKKKTFQVPAYRKPKVKISVIIAHELLHFVFYNYFLKQNPEFNKEKYQMQLWQLAEIFNEVVQSSSEWKKTFGGKPLYYPGHSKITRKILKDFNNRWTADELISEIRKEIKM